MTVTITFKDIRSVVTGSAAALRRSDYQDPSFRLAVAIALAGAKELWVLYHAHLPGQAWATLAVGLIVASISAFGAIWGLMRFLERFSTWPFVIYRAALGVFLLAGIHGGWLA